MKSTGIVRRIDQLGRIVIPRETRRTLDIHEKDAIEIFVEEESVILQKYKSDGTCLVTASGGIRTVSGKSLRIRGGDAGTVITRSHTKEEGHFVDFNQWISYERNRKRI